MSLVERVYAAGEATLPSLTASNSDTTDIGKLINSILTYVIYLAGIIAVIYLVYSGILYMTAAGNPDAAKKGQQGIVNAIIGIVVVILAYVIVKAVGGTVNTQIR